ncbi:MAG: hypothetical protein LBN21_07870 [Treponema sp.]|jgi:hypothetical protein|nr:hypothetical protein [Treponema sp.]
MDKNYYYLISQLPSLQYGEKAPYTPDEFLEQCKEMLSKSDYDGLKYCTLDIDVLDGAPLTQWDFINTWVARERTMRYALSHLRSVNLKRDDDEEQLEAPHESPRTEAGAHVAFAMGDPLEAEIYLDKNRWENIESIQGHDNFGINVIFAHVLKLKLMQRRLSFIPDEGLAEYKALYASILQGAGKV